MAMRRITMAMAWSCVALLLSQSNSLAQSIPPCPKSVLPIADEALKYKLRGDRCEGLFMQPVAAASHLEIIGYHEHAPAYVERSKNPLKVSVTLPSVSDSRLFWQVNEPADGPAQTGPIALRALAVRQKYRMDAEIHSGNTFLWDRNVLNMQQIDVLPRDMLILACEESCHRPKLRLLPVSVVADVPPPRQAPELVFRAAVDLSKLYIQITKLPNGQTITDEVLRGQQVLAGAPQHIPLGPLIRGGGTYRVIATAVPTYNAAGLDAVEVQVVAP
jgi:hypothetical protein